MRRTARLPLTLLLAAVVLTGCATPPPMPTAPPTPVDAPVFASDEEALAAAEEAYGAYMAAAVSVMADGGRNAERLTGLITPELLERDRSGYQTFVDNGWRAVGDITFTMLAQDIDLASGDITTYVCEDRSSFDVVDERSVSVVPPDQPNRTALEVSFVWQGKLLVSAQNGWEGGGVCD